MIKSIIFFAFHPKSGSKQNTFHVAFMIENNVIVETKEYLYESSTRPSEDEYSMQCNSELTELFEQYDFKYVYRNNKIKKTKLEASRLTKMNLKEYKFENKIKEGNIPANLLSKKGKKYFAELLPFVTKYSNGDLNSKDLSNYIKNTLIDSFEFQKAN